MKTIHNAGVLTLGILLLCSSPTTASVGDKSDPIVVASKNFTENYILAEIMSQLIEEDGFVVERRFGLGGTKICHDALINDEIDVYPEYTGTITQAILELQERLDVDEINEKLAHLGIEALPEFGFNNTYAMAMRRALSEELGVTKVSQLTAHPQLKFIVSHEFLEREDGWKQLQRVYGFGSIPEGIEHALAYRAIADGSIDVTDGYSTDAEILMHDLVALEDDRNAFPTYMALPLVRSDLEPTILAALSNASGRIDESTMIRLNQMAVNENQKFAEIADSFLLAQGLKETKSEETEEIGFSQWFSDWSDLRSNTFRHLQLSGIALILAALIGLTVSILIYRVRWLARGVVYICGLLQTIPSIALLALLIPVFGIGMVPAIIALFLYSLLPIVRNTVTTLSTTDPMLLRVAEAMGLSEFEQLRFIHLPLATPSIFAGIRTSAVICIGTATLAAFIGAGGLGDPIVTGLALNNTGLILQGAIPAAVLAILTELVFEALERVIVPGHLKVFGESQETPLKEAT